MKGPKSFRSAKTGHTSTVLLLGIDDVDVKRGTAAFKFSGNTEYLPLPRDGYELTCLYFRPGT